MRQVSNELARAYKWLIERINHVKFHHLIALAFTVISLVIRLSPSSGALGWLRQTYNVPGDILSTLFAISAIVIAYNPPKRYFAAALTPLIVYLAVFTLYAIQTSLVSVSAFWYICMIVALVWTLQFKTFGSLRLHHIYAIGMMLIGIGIYDTPSRGVAQWIMTRYSIPGEFLGVLIMLSALWLAFNPKPKSFIAATPIFVLYIGASFIFSLSGDLVGVAMSATMLTCIFWTHRHLHKYFEV